MTKSGKHVTGNWGFCSKGCPLEEGEYDYKPPEVDYGDYSDNDKSTGGRTEQILEAQSKFFLDTPRPCTALPRTALIFK